MTKSTTRKTATPRKTAQKQGDDKAPVPMDPAAVETTAPVMATNQPRVCYAAKTLLTEVAALFPDATYVDGERNGRNVLLGLTFELASLTDEDADNLTAVLDLIAHDERVRDVNVDREEGLYYVGFWNNPRTYDIRDSFGLIDAYTVLNDPEAEAVVVENDFEGSL